MIVQVQFGDLSIKHHLSVLITLLLLEAEVADVITVEVEVPEDI
jgi:hypothetical protein